MAVRVRTTMSHFGHQTVTRTDGHSSFLVHVTSNRRWLNPSQTRRGRGRACQDAATLTTTQTILCPMMRPPFLSVLPPFTLLGSAPNDKPNHPFSLPSYLASFLPFTFPILQGWGVELGSLLVSARFHATSAPSGCGAPTSDGACLAADADETQT